MGNNIDSLLEAQNKPFEYVAFSGGGAKGVTYSGMYEALEASRVLDGIKGVAGSSAGAITAALIATGMTPSNFKELTRNTNLKSLLGKGLISKDGAPLYDLMKKTICHNVSTYLENADILLLCKERLEVIEIESRMLNSSYRKKTQESVDRLGKLKEQEKNLKNIIENGGKDFFELRERSKDGGKIYFKDLNLLHMLDPVRFKELIVTATRKDNAELKIFNGRDTPEVEIALACRASASLPVILKPIKINGIIYIDGGYKDNIPLSYFKKVNTNEPEVEEITCSQEKIRKAKAEGRKLALAFGNGSDSYAHVAVYSTIKKIVNPNAVIRFLSNVVLKAAARVGGNFVYTDNEGETYKTLRQNGVNTVILDTNNISTLSFDSAQKQVDYLHLKGYMQTMRHFDNLEIASIDDPSFGYREFLLRVYEKINDVSIIQKFTNKVVGKQTDKLETIFSFCKDPKWQDRETLSVLEDFIQIAATHRSNLKADSSTNTVKVLVQELNNSSTSIMIKESFINLLGIDIKKDKNFDTKSDLDNFIASYKFKISDFNKIIDKTNITAVGGKRSVSFLKNSKDIIPYGSTQISAPSPSKADEVILKRTMSSIQADKRII